MDYDPLATLQAIIEAASPGTPSLTCRRIAEALIAGVRDERAEAWDEGYSAQEVDWHDGTRPNPYRD